MIKSSVIRWAENVTKYAWEKGEMRVKFWIEEVGKMGGGGDNIKIYLWKIGCEGED
jgi:hypothetical protein